MGKRGKDNQASPEGPSPEKKPREVVSEEELAGRRALGARYEAQQKISKIDEEVRGIRIAINILIRRENELLRVKSELSAITGGNDAREELCPFTFKEDGTIEP